MFNGLNFAFGGEQRHENFQITGGAPASYLTYDVNGNPVTDFANQVRPTDFFGNTLPGGITGICRIQRCECCAKRVEILMRLMQMRKLILPTGYW